MPRVGGSNGAVDAQAERLPLLLKFLGDDARELLRSLARCLGGALYFLAVLVGPGEQDGLVTLHPLEARDGLGSDRGVGVPDVRRSIHVVKRRGDVIFHLQFFKYSKLASAMICLSGAPVSIARRRQSSYSGA